MSSTVVSVQLFFHFPLINRKFADIEAANHRLASALYFKEEEKGASSLASHKLDSPEQSGNPSQSDCPQKADTDGNTKSSSVSFLDLHETQSNEKRKQSDSGHLWKHHPKSQSSTWTAAANNQSKRRQDKESRRYKGVEMKSVSSPKASDLTQGAEPFNSEYYNDESQSKPANDLHEDTETVVPNMDVSPSFSPELSPLSLDSCDFSIQMFKDLSACTQAQKSISDFPEGQLTDIMELFTLDNKDVGDCTDIEAYFESICACQGDEDVIFGDQSGNFSEVDNVHCEGEYRYDQGLTSSHFQGNQRSSPTLRQSAYVEEEPFNNFKLCQNADIPQNQVPSSVSYHYNVAQLQAYQCPQEESTCMQVNCENDLQFTPFEGVAQSFSAPLNNPEHRPIPTPPQEDDWLFTDILKDRKSPSY